MTPNVTREEAVAAYRRAAKQVKVNQFYNHTHLFASVKKEIEGLYEIASEGDGSYYGLVIQIIARCLAEVEEEDGASEAWALYPIERP